MCPQIAWQLLSRDLPASKAAKLNGRSRQFCASAPVDPINGQVVLDVIGDIRPKNPQQRAGHRHRVLSQIAPLRCFPSNSSHRVVLIAPRDGVDHACKDQHGGNHWKLPSAGPDRSGSGQRKPTAKSRRKNSMGPHIQ